MGVVLDRWAVFEHDGPCVTISTMGTAVPVTLGATRSRALDVALGSVASVVFPAGVELPNHQHPFTTLAIVLGGGFRGIHRAHERDCPPATVLIEPAGEPHGNRFGGEPTRVVAFSLTAAEAGSALESLARRLSFVRDPYASAIATQVAAEVEHPDDVSPLAVEGWLLQLVASLTRTRLDSDRPRWLRATRELLDERFAEPLRLADIAEAVGVEPTRLARAFRRAYREPLSSYVRRQRVAAAARLLDADDQPIARIAATVGFADQSHLTRAFVRNMRTTPGRYRTERRRVRISD
jgi:AraC family transcriptional regulator